MATSVRAVPETRAKILSSGSHVQPSTSSRWTTFGRVHKNRFSITILVKEIEYEVWTNQSFGTNISQANTSTITCWSRTQYINEVWLQGTFLMTGIYGDKQV